MYKISDVTSEPFQPPNQTERCIRCHSGLPDDRLYQCAACDADVAMWVARNAAKVICELCLNEALPNDILCGDCAAEAPRTEGYRRALESALI